MTFSISSEQFRREAEHIGPVWNHSASHVTYIHVKAEETYLCAGLSPLNSVTLKYAEVPGHGAPCKIYLNGDSAQKDDFWKAIRGVAKELGYNLCSGKGDGETASFEAIRPENAPQAIKDVLHALHERGVLLSDDMTKPVLDEGNFIDPEATATKITGELDRISDGFAYQIDAARQERDAKLAEAQASQPEASTHRYSLVTGAPSVGA